MLKLLFLTLAWGWTFAAQYDHVRKPDDIGGIIIDIGIAICWMLLYTKGESK